MKCSTVIGFLFTLALISYVAAEEDIDCGPNYPQGLPCIAGGQLVHDQPAAFEGMPSVMVLAYRTELRHLREGLELAAQHSDWTIDDWQMDQEPDGMRYRSMLRNGGQLVAVSVYMGRDDWALLQIMPFPEGFRD